MNKINENKTPRAALSRDKTTRRKPWAPPSSLDPTIQEGKYQGVIGVGGLLLAKIPTEIVEERMAYFRQQVQDKEEAVANDLLKEQHPSMPVSKPDRQSRVTFGGNRKN